MSPTLPQVTKTVPEALATAVKSTDSSYKLLYFPIHGRADLIRDLLAYSGATWEELPLDWPSQKPQVPFRVLPVVYEETTDGTVLEIAESQAIERYLARKYNLLGSDLWEEHLVNRYYHSSDVLQVGFGIRVVGAAPEARGEAAKKFYTETLAIWISTHEEHLKNNGDHGHYVGKTTTLADLKTAQLINRILLQVPKGVEAPLSAEKTPSLWKVKEAIEAESASLVAWHKSPRYEEVESNTKARFGF